MIKFTPKIKAISWLFLSLIVYLVIDYKANFEEIPNTNDAILKETFKNTKTGNVRQNKHELYMPSQASILSIAKDLGFILMGQIDMIRCQYDSQYLYILQKTN